MNAAELIEQLQRMDPDAPVVLVSAADPDWGGDVSHLVMDSGQAQLWVGAPVVLSHKLTGDVKPDRAPALEARLAALEAALEALQRPSDG